jgi:predicted acetyltransferase
MSHASLPNNRLNGVLHTILTGSEVRYMDNGYLVAAYSPHAEPLYRKFTRDHGEYWAPVPDYCGSEVETALLQLKYQSDAAYNLTIQHRDIYWMARIEEVDRLGRVVHAFVGEGKTMGRALAVAVYKHRTGSDA